MRVRYKTIIFGMVILISTLFICSLINAGGGVKGVKITNANANKEKSASIKPYDPICVGIDLVRTIDMELIIKIFNPEKVLWKIKKEKLTDKSIYYSFTFSPPSTGFIQGRWIVEIYDGKIKRYSKHFNIR